MEGRSEFIRMLDDIENDKFEIKLIKQIDRGWRNLGDWKMPENKTTSNGTRYRGTDSMGDIQVRVESGHSEVAGYTGPKTAEHVVPHMHIDRRANIVSGGYSRTTSTLPLKMFE